MSCTIIPSLKTLVAATKLTVTLKIGVNAVIITIITDKNNNYNNRKNTKNNGKSTVAKSNDEHENIGKGEHQNTNNNQCGITARQAVYEQLEGLHFSEVTSQVLGSADG